MKCEVCGKEIEKSKQLHKVLCSSKCFTTDFWNDITTHKDEYVIINGRSYYVADENATGPFRGFDGSLFKIKKHSGEIITTTNLWWQGSIPEEFREKIPNNAEWYKEEVK